MAYDALGNYVPDDAVPVDDMRHELIAKSKTPQFIKNLEAMYQLLPGSIASRSTAQGVKPIAETAATVGSGLAAPFLGVAKGIGQNILNNTNERVDRPELAEAFTYQPRTQTGQNYVESIMGALDASRLPPYVAHAGSFRFTPDDLRVAGKTAVSDVRNLPMDFANARAGFQREYPTLGSTLAGGVTRAEPLLEKGLSMYELGQLTPGFTPVSEAMKPKGGNWPTSLAREGLPLAEQGKIGEYFETSTIGPMKLWREQLANIPGADTDWYNFLRRNNAEDIPFADPRYLKLADTFTELMNNQARNVAQMAPGADPLPTIKPLSEFSKLTDAYNKWILEGPHKKYVLSQMGTGVELDPVLKAVDEANFNPFEIRYPADATQDRAMAKRDIERLRERYESEKTGYERSPNYWTNPETMFNPGPEFSTVGELTSKTPAGQLVENAQDQMLADYSSFYHPKYADDNYKQNFPFLSKLKIGTPVYDILNANFLDRTGLQDIKKHLLDKVVSGEISPEKLSSVSVESVVRDMINQKQDALKKAQRSKDLYIDWRKKNHETLPADIRFTNEEGIPTGDKMMVFDATMANENPDLVIRNLSQDTKDLNHCVGSCGHGTAEYPNRHVPMVEPHTGITPKGSDSSYGPNYVRRIQNGDIQIASLRGPDGEAKATLELRPERKKLDNWDKDNQIQRWLEKNAPDYFEEYGGLRSHFGLEPAIKNAMEKYPELTAFINSLESNNKFQVAQIKGEGNGKLKPEDAELVKRWLNNKGSLVKDNRISDLDNLPGVIDLRNTQPHEIADIYQTIHPDKLDNFFKELIDKKLEGDELGQERYSHGLLDPFELMSDEIPRFVSVDDLRKVAEKNGFDIERRPEDTKTTGAKTNGLNDMDRLILEMEITTFLDNGRLPADFADYLPDYQRDTLTLIGNQNPQAQLPRNRHEVLVERLLKQEEYKDWILDYYSAAHQNDATLGLTEPQMENIQKIIDTWLEHHPFED